MISAGTLILIVLGLCLFETVSSLDNAVINADVLATVGASGRRWFFTWGMIFAVFVVRGALPWVIVWIALPEAGPIGAFTAALSRNQAIAGAVSSAAPILLMGGGMFLALLFLHWLFLEPKHFGLAGEKFFARHGVWFYAFAAVLLAVITWFALRRSSQLAFSAIVGSTAFFITHGFRENAEDQSRRLAQPGLSDLSKILYLEIIDATFSIDGVLGAFAFTFFVPLIILGNGLGAVIVRQITIGNIERIRKLIYLKNGAMYSIFILGAVMMSEAFGAHLPQWVSPAGTVMIIGGSFTRSVWEVRKGSRGAGTP